MAAVIIISVLIHTACSHVIPVAEPGYSEQLVNCVGNIAEKYFASRRVLTYVGNKQDDEEFLKAIHNLNALAMISRRSSLKLPVRHESYIISARSTTHFIERFPNLMKETTWNPGAYFMIIVRSSSDSQFKDIFNELLKRHVNNVIVINATAEAHLYSYNPFDNYGCGEKFDKIISYGECSQMEAHNLFPYKYATGLNNCKFRVAVTNWPSCSIFSGNKAKNLLFVYGVELYLLKIISEMANFKLDIILQNGTETFSTISPDMEADGPLRLLQSDEAEIVLGGILLTPSRAFTFEYLHNLLPYVDDIRFVVKRAKFVAAWKTFYVEFDGIVWALILLSLILYSIIMVVLLQAQDKSLVVLKLLDNLVLHSCNLSCHSIIKCIFIIWVWSAYLLNAFYQSSLVSLTTNPAKEHQISTENDIFLYQLKPCLSETMEKYYQESMQTHKIISASECLGELDNVLRKVVINKEYYSLTLYGLYGYHLQHYFDEVGNPQLYVLKMPYSKVIYCLYFYKGFPLMHEISVKALRLTEIGLVGKAMSDIDYLQSIKHHFHEIKRNIRFVVPWHIFGVGCTISIMTFVIELLYKRN